MIFEPSAARGRAEWDETALPSVHRAFVDTFGPAAYVALKSLQAYIRAMSETLSVGLAQMNPVVGDIDGNVERMRALRAAGTGHDLMVFGELALAGYPPEDLVLKRAFQDSIESGVRALAADTADGGPALLIGAPWRHGGALYNAALLLQGAASRRCG